MASGSELGSSIGITKIGDENLNSILQHTSKRVPTISALLRKPLGESDKNTQGPTPERTPSPSSRNLAKLEAKRKAKVAAGTLLPKNKPNSSSDLVPYLQYRERQKRETGADREAIWDEEIENAFMAALHEIPLIGRQKRPNGEGKPCGRNELISEYILKTTGKYRCRKQVSSHIQVLKHLLKDNPDFMSLVSSEKSKPSWKTEDGLWDNTPAKSARRRIVSPSSDRQSSSSSFSGSPAESDFHFPTTIPILFSQTGQTRICESTPVRFGIWVKFSEGCSMGEAWSLVSGGYHTYTELPDDHLPGKTIALSSLTNWESRFPYLQEVLRDGFATTTIIHLRCSLSLLMSFPIETSMLGSILEISHTNITHKAKWECVTRIYAPGQEVWKMSQEVFPSDDMTKLRLPFASEFWSAFFTGLSNGGHSNTHETSTASRARQEKEARTALAGITVVQELFIIPTGDYAHKIRKAIFLSDFTKAEPHQRGITQWRAVIPPFPTSGVALPVSLSPIVSPATVMSYDEPFGAVPIMDSIGLSHQYMFTANAPGYFMPAIDDGTSYTGSCSSSFDSVHHGFPQLPQPLRDNYFQSYVGVDPQQTSQGSSQTTTILDNKNYDPAFSTDLTTGSSADLYPSGVWVADEVSS